MEKFCLTVLDLLVNQGDLINLEHNELDTDFVDIQS